MNMAATRTLSAEQTETFNVEYVNDDLWVHMEPALARYLSKPSNFLDVGGGNGMYVDRITEAFPQAVGTNVEPAANLVDSNRPHPRKRLINAPYQGIDFEAEAGRYDVVCFNWVLHHFVSDSYAQTVACQTDALASAAKLLKPGGALLILENLYNGIQIDNLPSRLIYGLTASRALRAVTNQLGANTAGTGVCFHSGAAWERILGNAGFDRIERQTCYRYGELSPLKRAALHMRQSEVALIVAEKS